MSVSNVAKTAQQSGLQKHKQTHTGEKPYEGNQCDPAFACQSGLLYHKTTLTGEKPYGCNECGKVFVLHSYFQIHKEHILERNPLNMTNVVKPLCVKVVSSIIKEPKHTGKKPCDCMSDIFRGTKETIL